MLLPFPATSASPPEAEKPSSVPPSTPGCRVRGGRQCSGAGAVTRLPSRAYGLCGHKQTSWGFPGRLEPRESQPPTKRKVKEKRARRNGEDKHPQRRLREGQGRQLLAGCPRCLGSARPRRCPPAPSPGAQNLEGRGEGGRLGAPAPPPGTLALALAYPSLVGHMQGRSY